MNFDHENIFNVSDTDDVKRVWLETIFFSLILTTVNHKKDLIFMKKIRRYLILLIKSNGIDERKVYVFFSVFEQNKMNQNEFQQNC